MMVLLMAFSNAHSLIFPIVSSSVLRTNLKIRPQAALLVVRTDCFLGFKELKKVCQRRTISGFLCKGSSENDEELDLEREIYEFMKNSRYPDKFPSKKELLDAGRVDLVNAIIEKGGWLSTCSDGFDEENKSEEDEFDNISGSCRSSHQSTAPSGETLLEKHRNSSFDIYIEKSKNEDDHADSDMSDDTDAKISYREKSVNREESKYKSLSILDDGKVRAFMLIETNLDQIGSEIRDLQIELSSSLRAVQSVIKILDQKGHELTSDKLPTLLDIFLFFEKKIKHANDKMEFIRAKFVVLERKALLWPADLQKIVAEQQRKIDDIDGALKPLRTTYISWPVSLASEIWLSGSFDGWITQRKMKKSSTGIFYLFLKLYPGRYEIKFIVDGVWKLDPLRPTVKNSGYENNILIVK